MIMPETIMPEILLHGFLPVFFFFFSKGTGSCKSVATVGIYHSQMSARHTLLAYLCLSQLVASMTSKQEFCSTDFKALEKVIGPLTFTRRTTEENIRAILCSMSYFFPKKLTSLFIYFSS